MFSNIQTTIKHDVKQIKRRYRIMKIKWIALFVLPIILILLAYHVTKQLIHIKMKELGTRVKEHDVHHRDESKQTT